jgi:hypothetical protein
MKEGKIYLISRTFYNRITSPESNVYCFLSEQNAIKYIQHLVGIEKNSNWYKNSFAINVRVDSENYFHAVDKQFSVEISLTPVPIMDHVDNGIVEDTYVQILIEEVCRAFNVSIQGLTSIDRENENNSLARFALIELLSYFAMPTKAILKIINRKAYNSVYHALIRFKDALVMNKHFRETFKLLISKLNNRFSSANISFNYIVQY